MTARVARMAMVPASAGLPARSGRIGAAMPSSSPRMAVRSMAVVVVGMGRWASSL
jgi:hypothetical protein